MVTYSTEAIINITAETITVSYLIMLIIHLHRSDAVQRKKQQSFLMLSSVWMLLVFADLIFRIFENQPGRNARTILYTTTFMVYLGYIIGALVYINYVLQYVGQPKDKGRIPLSFLLIFTLSNVMLLVATQFNGFFYYFDENNVYHRSPGMQYLAITLVIEVISAIIVLVMARKSLEISERIFSYIFAAIPFIAGMIQLQHYGLAVINVACGFAVFILYFNVQARREHEYYVQQKAITDQQVALMISQIQPHFLYNAIASIRELCLIDPTEARAVLGDFAIYLRGNMDSIKSKGLIPFEKELDHVRHYLKIEQLRFGDLLEVEYDLEVIDFDIPSLCLEPIVENAVKHGTCSKDEGGTVTIMTRAYGDSVEIIVKDDGEGFDCPSYEDIPQKDDGRSHIGIGNVKSRIEDIAKGQFTFVSEKGVGTTVRLIIPNE